MGGSEEAVYYTAQQLARRGYRVVVYAGITEGDHGFVQSYPKQTFCAPYSDASGSNASASDTNSSIDSTGPAARRDGSCGNTADGDGEEGGSVTWQHLSTYNPRPPHMAPLPVARDNSATGLDKEEAGEVNALKEELEEEDEEQECEVFIAWRYAISLAVARTPHFLEPSHLSDDDRGSGSAGDGGGRIPFSAHHASATNGTRNRGTSSLLRVQEQLNPLSRCGKKFLWLHDLIPGHILPPSYFKHFDGILVQSAFHKNHVYRAYEAYANAAKATSVTEKQRKNIEKDLLLAHNHVFVVPNGIDNSAPHVSPGESEVVDTEQPSTQDSSDKSSTDKNKLDSFRHENVSNTDTANANAHVNVTLKAKDNTLFVYGSAPNRGLSLVLSQWPTIRRAIPTASLEVYYGFTPSVVRELQRSLGGGFAPWYQQMQRALQQPGVRYMGAVSHAQLQEAYRRAGFLLYPSIFQETGCITVLRAMAAGAIPITSRLTPSVLSTLTEGFDMGPLRPLFVEETGNSSLLNTWVTQQWTPAVVRAYSTDAAELLRRRREMQDFIKNHYTWEHTAAKLESLF
jgi:glycosyltransferase involved in cell wall biosynthesis